MPMDYKNRTALIVDDQEFVRRIVSTMLGQIGFGAIETATDGETAMEATRKHKPDIIICDIKMKPMNGLVFLETLQNDPDLRGRDIPIIFLTGELSGDYVAKAKELGCNAFLLKPVPPHKLREKIDHIFFGKE